MFIYPRSDAEDQSADLFLYPFANAALRASKRSNQEALRLIAQSRVVCDGSELAFFLNRATAAAIKALAMTARYSTSAAGALSKASR
jgi:hypothetical protein